MTDNAGPHVLVVDDDIELTAMLRDYLEAEGFRIDALFNGADAVPAAISGGYDAVILDVMLPRLCGIEALRRIREKSAIPVIMLTARGDDIDRVIGLELGADDYVPKPYFPRELVARLRAVLRRHPAAAAADPPPLLRLGGLDVDIAARRVQHGGRRVDLTASEFNLLVALIQAAGKVASKDALSQTVLGRPHASYDRSIDVHVSNLRQKLAAALGSDIEIETVRGIGYRIGRLP
ncbi:response regulator transcription factor [Flavisphingomonas formosensis]|uniref:response regulator transcription factor n=1 Tax=Flavisphingomonas formosensis TaxID=861534 RepID=UPI0012F71EB0|nr:response regulator transcription factor [Sphingomonas formosensis]